MEHLSSYSCVCAASLSGVNVCNIDGWKCAELNSVNKDLKCFVRFCCYLQIEEMNPLNNA